MAKGNFFMGTVAGKLGDVVFMRRKGEQVSRMYIKKVSNPATRAQMTQRTALTNIIRLYQCSPSFFAKAFENKPVNQSDYNALVSANLNRNPRIYLPKEMSDAGGGVVAPYEISHGSIQPILVSGSGVSAKTNIAIGLDFTVNASMTIASLSAAILANNTFIQAGDQLSYLSIEQYSYQGYSRLRARKYELVIDVNDPTLVYDVFPEQAIVNSGGFIGHGALVYSGAFAWILSRNENGKLKVSTQTLICTSDSLYLPYSGPSAVTAALASYKASGGVFLDPDSSGDGMSSVPSIDASIASVKLQSTILQPGIYGVSLAAANTIAAGALAITGSGLSDVENLSLIINNGSGSITVPFSVTAANDTSASNTEAISVPNTTTVEGLSILLNGVTLFSWTAAQTGGDPENPLA